MKNIKSIITLCLSFVLLVSCEEDFLVRTPPDALPEDGFYNSPERAIAAVNAAYATLQSENLYSDQLQKPLEGSSDDAILSNTTGTEFQNFAYASSNALLMSIYSRLYEGVYRSNQVLVQVPQIEMDATLQDRIIGEAKFLRALYYWHLSTMFGDVPLYTEPFDVPDDALVAKSSIEEIYAVMIQDLLDAEAVLPVSYDASEAGRATRGAAQSLLGKVYLYAEDYENAENWLGEVISSGTYSLVDEYQTIIHREYENDAESIFEVQFMQVGESDVQSIRDEYNLPQGQGGFGNLLPIQSIVSEYEEYNGATAIDGRDPRLFYSIFRDGDPFAPNLGDPAMETYNSGWSVTNYNLRKGLTPVILVNNGGTNFPIIRYADVLLMYAEAANELGMLSEARAAVNEVRQRPSVGMPLLTPAETGDQNAMFEAIVHERRVELAFEYHRFNDLRRWGLAEEYLGANGYSERNRYFPLPQEELDTNPNLVQRDNW